MEDYRLTQTGPEVQEILDGAAMQSDLTAEVERAEGAEGILQNNIDAETLAREGADQTLQGNIDAINAKIPAQASSENRLADKAFVNDAIATSSATYRGSFNLVSDLHLTTDATQLQIATALALAIATADNNDYCFVQVPTSAETPTEIARIDRYKFNGEAWAFEYSLNNSGFTAAQWAAINSGITSGAVSKLAALPTNSELTTLLNGKQNTLTFDNAPTQGSNNPVTSGGVYTAEKALSDAIDAILALIPSAATALNQLADKEFVNSSIATATAVFRGTYNLVSDLSLTIDATHAQIAAALLNAISTADNNDYAFVQIPTSVDTPTEIRVTERYKFNGTAWAYEYDLNNSGFTAAQWAAINSAITASLVSKLSALPTNAELTTLLNGKQNTLTFDTTPATSSSNPVTSEGIYNAIAASATSVTDAIMAVISGLDATFNITSTDGHVTVKVTQVNGAITNVEVLTSDIASAADLSALTTVVGTKAAQTDLTALSGRVTENESDIADLQQLYQALQQSAPVIIQPTDTWPVANPSQTVIYRVIDRVNTPPQYYSDYMWNGTAMVQMAQYNNAIDTVPTAGSHNLVESGGVYKSTLRGNVVFFSGSVRQEKKSNNVVEVTSTYSGNYVIGYIYLNYGSYVYIKGTSDKVQGGKLVYSLSNFDQLALREGTLYILTDQQIQVTDIVLGININGKLYGIIADWIEGVRTPSLVSLFNGAELYYRKDSQNRDIYDGDFCITPFIDVTGLDGIYWQAGTSGTGCLTCYDENMEFISGWYWTSGNLRDIDFERGTTAGDSIKYVRASMFLPSIGECYIKDYNKNILWSVKWSDVLKKPAYKPFSVVIQGDNLYKANDDGICVVEFVPSNTTTYPVGYADFEDDVVELVIYGDAGHYSDGKLTYNINLFEYLVARLNEDKTKLILTVVNYNALKETDICLLYAARSGQQGVLAEQQNEMLTKASDNAVSASEWNGAQLGVLVNKGFLRADKDFCVTPYIDVTGIAGVWYAGGRGNYSQAQLCCYDENKNYIYNYYWSINTNRYIDFERGTSAGASVKYVRASMYIPAIDKCSIKDPDDNILWNLEKQDEDGIPSYYNSYLDTIQQKIEERILSLGSRNDCYIFFTDVHTNNNNGQSGKLIGELMRRTNVNKVYFGGDIIRAWGGRSEILEDAAVFTELWYKNIKPYGELYSVQGNHDLTIATSSTDLEHGYTFPYQAIRNYFMERQAVMPELHYDENNPQSIYFYFDNKGQKIRYIFVSTTDTARSGNVGFGVDNGFHKLQSDWCYQAIAQAPSGYGVVVIGHEAAAASTAIYVRALADFLAAFKNKTSVTINAGTADAATYNFSDVDAVMLFMIDGHEHRDELSVYGNVPYITSCCDAATTNYQAGQFGRGATDYPQKTAGTIYEQTFDIGFIDIEHSVLYLIRFGGGYDRIVHFDTKQVSVGGSITLQSTLTNPDWLSCDGTGNTWKGSSYPPAEQYEDNNTKVSVSNGVVNGVAAGNAVVCARSTSDMIMELYCIEVIS